MYYLSTRGHAPILDFPSVLLTGLATDGGLYLPESWPSLSTSAWQELRGLRYTQLAARLISLFTGTMLTVNTLEHMADRAYSRFHHPAIVPLVQLDHDFYVQELFHGPTLAFKDVAMQLLAQFFDYILTERDQYITVIVATSGDTGSSAIEAFRHLPRVRIVVLHPLERISAIQRRQMTTIISPNVLNLALQGTFDDCQDMVKALFSDKVFRQNMALTAVNSINWARIIIQIPYYVYSALQLGVPDREVSFAVPTGNFGNIFAAWAAHRMGLPIRSLVIGSNHNDILTRFISDNDMSIRSVQPSLSPSMDIQISSNFERLLFEMLNRDAETLTGLMTTFRKEGHMHIPKPIWTQIRGIFSGLKLENDQIITHIRRLKETAHYLADPHSIIGIAAGTELKSNGIPMIAMATAHPSKFPDTMQSAVGTIPALPSDLNNLLVRPEQFLVVPNKIVDVKNVIYDKFPVQ